MGVSIASRLGIKSGQTIQISDPPDDYDELLGPLPDNIKFINEHDSKCDLVQVFVRTATEAEIAFTRLTRQLSPTGMLWVCWPKGRRLLNENHLRHLGHQRGLVDVKVISISPIWLGLKFVHRKVKAPL